MTRRAVFSALLLLAVAKCVSGRAVMHGQVVGRLCVDDDADYYMRRRSAILRDCGQLCDLTPSSESVVRRRMTCAALWNSTVDAEPPLRWPPPPAPPCSMLDDFLSDGRSAPLRRWYFVERDESAYSSVWTAVTVDSMVELCVPLLDVEFDARDLLDPSEVPHDVGAGGVADGHLSAAEEQPG